MLGVSDYPIERALEYFTRHGIDVGFVVPTATGLDKGIMDAHQSFRDFLDLADIHDFAVQGQGEAHKILLPVTRLTVLGTEQTTLSLYRPPTKQGDPRLWVYGLKKWARPGNLIALFVVGGGLFVVNVSDPDVWEGREDPDAPLGDVVAGSLHGTDIIAVELLDRIKEIARRGWTPNLRTGDTGIGYTLESLLGIVANSRPEPDYKGIELKSARGRKAGRSNLFAKTPDWSRSELKSTRDLLEQYGYMSERKGLVQLFATVYATHATPGGFQLQTGAEDVALTHVAPDHRNNLAVWANDTLRTSLTKKHASTFWVRADTRTTPDGSEEFQFQSVTYTRAPLISAFIPLVEAGSITVDLTCFYEGASPKDKGYLWKIAPSSFSALFPTAVEYDLLF